MKHFGVLSSPVPGHLNPLCAVGRELVRRGHRVTVFHMADAEAKVLQSGVGFCLIGETDFPSGSWEKNWVPLARRTGFSTILGTVALHKRMTEMMCRDVPDRAEAIGVNAWIVDQSQFEGAAIAKKSGHPYVTLACALTFDRDPEGMLPPPFIDWQRSFKPAWLERLRNRAGFSAFDVLASPLMRVTNRYCRKWGMPQYRSTEDTFSRLLHLAPLVRELDFSRPSVPEGFEYVGCITGEKSDEPVEFPYERLDGRPLVYASLGTLQNQCEPIFERILEATRDFDFQLVLSLGNWRGLGSSQAMMERLQRIHPEAIIVPFAPQVELISRASLTITHAGPNTVMESLAHGVPMVAIPITNDQPAIGARIAWSGTGEVISLRKLTTEKLKLALRKVMGDASYRSRAQELRETIRKSGGLQHAADLIEAAVGSAT